MLYISGMIKIFQKDAKGRTVSGKCQVCGHTVELGHFTCECDRCGQLYNWAGQALLPEHEWEEDY